MREVNITDLTLMLAANGLEKPFHLSRDTTNCISFLMPSHDFAFLFVSLHICRNVKLKSRALFLLSCLVFQKEYKNIEILFSELATF